MKIKKESKNLFEERNINNKISDLLKENKELKTKNSMLENENKTLNMINDAMNHALIHYDNLKEEVKILREKYKENL